MALERIALISDVHGNLTAYRAVLADIAARGITRVFNLGDVVGKGPRGAACTALTRERCAATVRGNWEVFIAGEGEPRSAAQDWWRAELSADDRAWLRQLPGSLDLHLSGRLLRLMHASPIDEFTRVHREHSEEQFAMMFAPTPFTGGGRAADVVIYGDIHDPFLRSGREGMLANVGSVGNQLDDPTPSYVILEGDPRGGPMPRSGSSSCASPTTSRPRSRRPSPSGCRRPRRTSSNCAPGCTAATTPHSGSAQRPAQPHGTREVHSSVPNFVSTRSRARESSSSV
ncbi:metallophosphoesterase family protein [Brachybacterium sp. Z12]|uniref:metallophosphoesterase family protein n=1 Tax=Brachybacterium sp. Z12 TaxID=2759167 RepID=UPI00292A5D65|nr:metallophosphoesterase family protein [Brachybacterium sp. Z12]